MTTDAVPITSRRAVLLTGLMLAGVAASRAFTPTPAPVGTAPRLDESVPTQFGSWKEVPSSLVQVGLTANTEKTTDQPYDQVVMRRYREAGGGIVLLALAWGANQRQEVKIHRPDLCYAAQGFQVQSLVPVKFDAIASAFGGVLGKRMVAFNGPRGEAVSYWIRIGRLYSEHAFATRMHILREGLSGRNSDGILVRASVPIADARGADSAFRLAEGFLGELVAATAPAARALLIQ